MVNTFNKLGLLLVLTFCSAINAEENGKRGSSLTLVEYLASRSVTNVQHFLDESVEFDDDKSLLIADHLIDVLAPKSLDVSVKIIRTPKLISLVTESNRIVVSTGLVGSLTSVGEFAAILAEELAHISLDHYVVRDSYRAKALAVSRGLGPLTFLAATGMSNVAVDNFRKEQEVEAREVAGKYLSSAGFSVKYFEVALKSIRENLSTDDPFYYSHPHLYSEAPGTSFEGRLQDPDREEDSVFQSEFVELSKAICEINIQDNLRYRRFLRARSTFDQCTSVTDSSRPIMRFLDAVITRRIITYVEHIKSEMASMPRHQTVSEVEDSTLTRDLYDQKFVSVESSLRELATLPGFEVKAMLELGELYYDLGEFDKSLITFKSLRQLAQPDSRWFALAESYISAIEQQFVSGVVGGEDNV